MIIFVSLTYTTTAFAHLWIASCVGEAAAKSGKSAHSSAYLQWILTLQYWDILQDNLMNVWAWTSLQHYRTLTDNLVSPLSLKCWWAAESFGVFGWGILQLIKLFALIVISFWHCTLHCNATSCVHFMAIENSHLSSDEVPIKFQVYHNIRSKNILQWT